eukprot:522017-Rhodomonas_salina.2
MLVPDSAWQAHSTIHYARTGQCVASPKDKVCQSGKGVSQGLRGKRVMSLRVFVRGKKVKADHSVQHHYYRYYEQEREKGEG